MICFSCSKETKNKFCSQDCYHAYKRRMYNIKYTKPCVICNIDFRHSSTAPNVKTCSKQCLLELYKKRKWSEDHRMKISETLKRHWKEIGYGNRKGVKLTKDQKKKISKSVKGKNAKEKNGNWIDGKVTEQQSRGENWDETRKEVYIRDNHTCQDCLKTKCKVECHHIIPWRISKDSNMKNLITLCKSCHKKRDNEIIRTERKEAFEKANTVDPTVLI